MENVTQDKVEVMRVFEESLKKEIFGETEREVEIKGAVVKLEGMRLECKESATGKREYSAGYCLHEVNDEDGLFEFYISYSNGKYEEVVLGDYLPITDTLIIDSIAKGLGLDEVFSSAIAKYEELKAKA